MGRQIRKQELFFFFAVVLRCFFLFARFFTEMHAIKTVDCWWHFLLPQRVEIEFVDANKRAARPAPDQTSPVVILLIMHMFFSWLVLGGLTNTFENNVHDQKDTKVMIIECPGWSIYVYLRFSSRWNLLYCGDLLWEGTIDVDTCLIWSILVV